MSFEHGSVIGILTLLEMGLIKLTHFCLFLHIPEKDIPIPILVHQRGGCQKINIHGCLGPKSYNYVGMFATSKREIDIFALYPVGGEIWFIIFGFAGYGN